MEGWTIKRGEEEVKVEVKQATWSYSLSDSVQQWNHQYQDFEITAGKMKDSARYAVLASDPSNNYHCTTLTSEETLRGKEVFWSLIQGRQKT